MFLLPSAIKLWFFIETTNGCSSLLCFLSANIGISSLEKNQLVFFLFFCIRANSTIRSSLKWIATGKFLLDLALPSFEHIFTFFPVSFAFSILCRAKISWYSSRISSTAFFLPDVSSDLVPKPAYTKHTQVLDAIFPSRKYFEESKAFQMRQTLKSNNIYIISTVTLESETVIAEMNNFP